MSPFLVSTPPSNNGTSCRATTQPPAPRIWTAYLSDAQSVERAAQYLMRHWPGEGYVLRGTLRGIPLVYTGKETLADLVQTYQQAAQTPTRGQVVAFALVALTLYGVLGMALWLALVLGLRLLGVR